jgi:hypothetical protein
MRNIRQLWGVIITMSKGLRRKCEVISHDLAFPSILRQCFGISQANVCPARLHLSTYLFYPAWDWVEVRLRALPD